MAKKAWFQFYPGDWKRDPELRKTKLATRGALIEMICAMDDMDSFSLTGTHAQLARICGCQEDEMREAILDLSVTKALHVTVSDENVTVVSRRRKREQLAKAGAAERMRKHRTKRKSYAPGDAVESESESESESYTATTTPRTEAQTPPPEPDPDDHLDHPKPDSPEPTGEAESDLKSRLIECGIFPGTAHRAIRDLTAPRVAAILDSYLIAGRSEPGHLGFLLNANRTQGSKPQGSNPAAPPRERQPHDPVPTDEKIAALTRYGVPIELARRYAPHVTGGWIDCYVTGKDWPHRKLNGWKDTDITEFIETQLREDFPDVETGKETATG